MFAVVAYFPAYLPVLCQVSTIEFSLIEVSILHGLKQGNDILKEIHKEMNVESVEKLLEETAEAREYQKVSLEETFCQRHHSFKLLGSGRYALEQSLT